MKKLLTTIFLLSICYFVKAQTNIDTEPTNNTTPGVSFSLPVNNNANISSSSDVDFYKVDVVTPGVLVITTSGANTNLLSRIEVFNSNGSGNTNSEGYKLSTVAGVNNTIEIITKAAGTYYIKISNGQSTTSSSPYNVNISIDNSDIYEYNDNSSALGSSAGMVLSLDQNAPTIINAKLYGYSRTIMNNYAYADFPDLDPDFDTYKINVNTTGVLVINLSNIPSNIAGGIEVFNSNGTSATTFSEGYREATVNGGSLNFEVLTKSIGDYYIVIYNSNSALNGANTSTQAYTLSMSIDSLGGEYNDNASTATGILLNTNKLGKIRGFQRLTMNNYAYADFPDLIADVDYYKTANIVPNFEYAKVSNVSPNLTMRITALASDGVTVLGSKTATVAGTDVTLLVGDIVNSGTVQYFVVEDINLVNGTNTSDQPYTFIVSTFPQALSDLTSNNLIQIYPNPTTSYLSVQNNSNFPITNVCILDIYGKKVMEIKNSNNFSVQTLTKGIYFLNATIDGKQYQTKFIKE